MELCCSKRRVNKSKYYIWCSNSITSHDGIYTGSSLSVFGTETTIGDTDTQDDMFIRFSDQEDINTYTPGNTAGTQNWLTDHRSEELSW